MPYKSKNKLSAEAVFKSDHFCDNGKMKPVKDAYPCENYIQAITVKETLKIITGKTYDIKKNGITGWEVVTKR